MTMTASDSEAGPRGRVVRRRDRRLGLADLLAALSRAIADRSDSFLLRSAFEETLARLVPVKSVRLRENVGRWNGRGERPGAIESIALDVPGGDAGGVLEAAVDPGSALGEWDCQLLGIAAHVGAFVLEIDRNRFQLARAGLRPGSQGEAPHRRADRIDTRHAGAARTDRSRRRNRLHDPPGRRERRRQRAGGAADSPIEPAAQRPVRGCELCRPRGHAARGGAVRHRGADGDRGPRAARKVRAR